MCVDHPIMQAPVDRLRSVEERRRDAVARFGNDVTMSGFKRGELGVRRSQSKLSGRFAFDDGTELKCIADELHVDRGDLQTPLRRSLQQAFRVESRNNFTDGA